MNKKYREEILQELREFSTLVFTKPKEWDEASDGVIEYTNPDDIAEEQLRLDKLKAEIRINNIIPNFSLSKDFKDRFNKGSRDISQVQGLINAIRTNVPIVLDNNGKPDMAGVCKAIREYSEEVFDALAVFSVLPRSAWGVSLTKCASSASFTPIVLAAYKKDFKFSDWDTEHNACRLVAYYICLGTSLANMAIARPKICPTFDADFLKSYSKNGAKKMPFKTDDAIKDSDDMRTYYEWYSSSAIRLKDYTHMLSQTWIAHPSLRSDNMILDIYDWSSVPEALTAVNEVKTASPYAEEDL